MTMKTGGGINNRMLKIWGESTVVKSKGFYNGVKNMGVGVPTLPSFTLAIPVRQ